MNWQGDLSRALDRGGLPGAAAGPACAEIAGIPAVVGLDQVTEVVERIPADTVAVLACPEISGVQLRELAWELEKTDTDLCVAPALLDVAGPRTTIRPVAGLTLLHVDHPEFTGARQLIKAASTGCLAALSLLILRPLFPVLTMVIRCSDGGPPSSGRSGWARTAARSPSTSSGRWCWMRRTQKEELVGRTSLTP